MEPVKLPLANPVITSYPTTTAVLSITWTDPASQAWFYNNFIQLYSRGREFIRTGLEFYNDFIYKFCPLIRREYLNRESLNVLNMDIAELLAGFLKAGKYILIHLNMFHIRAYAFAYNQVQDYHATFIYGCDCRQQLFFIADFFEGKYSRKTATFEEVRHAYSSMVQFTIEHDISGLSLLSLNPSPFNLYENEKWVFSPELTASLLRDYLSSTDSYALLNLPKDNLICGIGVYALLMENLQQLVLGELSLSQFHIKPFHISWNHKTVMLARIKYMGEAGCLEEHIRFYEEYQEIVKLSFIIRSIALKSFVTQDAGLMGKVIDHLHSLVEKETVILQKLADQIHVSGPEDCRYKDVQAAAALEAKGGWN